MTRLALLVIALAALPGCAMHAPDARSAPGAAPAAGVRVDTAYGFSIDIPPGVAARPDFTHGYLDDGAWKAYAPPDSHGVPRLALVLPGSGPITAGELRVGVSENAADIAQCLAPPDAATGPGRAVSLGGGDFMHFRAQDAAMSHYLIVDAYRTVHAGRCYAVDLMVHGTNPQVFSPPATPPFTSEQAMSRLRGLLAGFRFIS